MNTTYFLNQVMGNLFKTKETPALPSEYYIGLSSTAPNMRWRPEIYLCMTPYPPLVMLRPQLS